MTDSIHGHEVMQMMLAADTPFTRESLKLAMADKFGADARYHTCSAVDMDAEQLIDFLAARNKFVGDDNGFTTAKNRICNH